MSTPITISDAGLEAMLARRANRADAGDLRDAAFLRIEATAQHTAVSLRRLALIAAAIAVLAAAAGAVIGARLLDSSPPDPFDSRPANLFAPGPRALVPTGIDVLLADPTSYTALVADGHGYAWLREDTGAIVRFDPLTGTRQSWSVVDDAAFGSTEQIIPARGGGIWLVGRRALWWFDGERIRDGFETPTDLPTGSAGDVAVATEAPDGTLWATTRDGTVLHREGASWSRLAAPMADGACAQPDAGCFPSAMTVDRAGRPWIGWSVYPVPPGGPAWVSRYDGGAWTTFQDPRGRNQVLSIAQQQDGSMLVELDGGFARLDGAAWAEVPAEFDAGWCTDGGPAADGTVRCAGPGTGPGSVRVFRFDGRTWVPDAEGGGLPTDAAATVVAARAGTYVAAVDGSPVIYGLADDRWEPAWEAAPPAVPRPRIAPDGRPLLAISRDELWAIGEGGGVWHFLNGAWALEAIDPGHPDGMVRSLALAPGGTPWAAGDNGVASWRDGRWVVADPRAANVATVDREGTVWVSRDRGDISTLAPDGTGWTSTAVATCPPGCFDGGGAVWSMAVDQHGALWVGAGGFVDDALARWAEGRWETFDASDGVPKNIGVEIIGTTTAGEVWIGFRPANGDLASGYARYDGTAWTLIEPPGSPVIAPDGTPWAPTARGPASFDGQRWRFPYPSAAVAGDLSVAPDGTVFAQAGSSLWRFPRLSEPAE